MILEYVWVTKTNIGHLNLYVEVANLHWKGRLRGTRKAMPFAISRVWRESKGHNSDYHYRMIDVKSIKMLKEGNLFHIQTYTRQ